MINKKLMEEIEDFLKEIFVIKAQIDARGSTVVLGERLIFPRIFMNAISEVLFGKYQVSNVFYLLSDIMPLYATGLESGIIVDCGFVHSSVSGVAHAIFSLRGHKHAYIGSSNLEFKLKELLQEDNPGNADKITSEVIQNVVGKGVKVLSRPKKLKFFETEENITKMKQKLIPLSISDQKLKDINISFFTMVTASELFFPETSKSDGDSIVSMILDSLLQAFDRVLVANNLILSGGLFMIPGFKKRVLEEIDYALETNSKYKEIKPLKPILKVQHCIYPSNCLIWIGASMVACLNEEVNTFGITRQEYMDIYKKDLPDRYGHCFLTCSRMTEPESSDEEKEVEEDEDGKPLDKSFKVPETKRDANYFNKEFEEINKKRKHSQYLAMTPYSTRGIGRPTKFSFPS